MGRLLSHMGRTTEAFVLTEEGATIARRHGLTRVEMQSEVSLADLCMARDLPEAEEHCQAALALSRRWGARRNEAFAAGNLMYVMILSGRLEEARRLGSGILEAVASDLPSTPLLYEGLGHIAALRGDPETARACLSECRAWVETSEVQFRVAYGALEAATALAEGSHRSSLEAALRAVDQALAARMPVATDAVRTAVAVAIEAARSIPDLEAADGLVSRLDARPIGELPPFVRAQLKRYAGLRLAESGDLPGADAELAGSQAIFQDLEVSVLDSSAAARPSGVSCRRRPSDRGCRSRSRGRRHLRATRHHADAHPSARTCRSGRGRCTGRRTQVRVSP